MTGNLKGLLLMVVALIPFFVWCLWPDGLSLGAWVKLLAAVIVGAGVVCAIPISEQDHDFPEN